MPRFRLLLFSFTPLLLLLFANFFAACQNPKCHAALCQGCCNFQGLCLEGNTLEACGIQGEACMRCNSGQICSSGFCLGGNPNTYPGSNSDGNGNSSPSSPSSALWWIEDTSSTQSTLHRYLPKTSLHTAFPFSFPALSWNVSPNGKRWAVGLATSTTQYEVLDERMRRLHMGAGVPQKMAFAQNNQGLAFLVSNDNNQGLLFGSAEPQAAVQRISFAKCGLEDNNVSVLDFAWSPDSFRLAVLARLGDSDLRAGIWLLTATEGACVHVVYPGEAMGTGTQWGAFGPLLWKDNTLFFRASLDSAFPLQLYSSGVDGIRNPLFSAHTHALLHFTLHPSLSLLALLQNNPSPSLSFLSLNPLLAHTLAGGCETENFAQTQTMLFSPAKDWLALAGNARSQRIRLSDMTCSPSPVPTLELAWSPNGHALAELAYESHGEWLILLSQNNGQTLLDSHVLSASFQHLHHLRWTTYAGTP